MLGDRPAVLPFQRRKQPAQITLRMRPRFRTVKQRAYPVHDTVEFLLPRREIFPRDRPIRQKLTILLSRIHALMMSRLGPAASEPRQDLAL